MGYKILVPFLALSSVLFVVNVVFSALAGATEGVVFKSQTGKISDKFPSYITPSGWTFMIWNVIFVAIFASLVFVIAATVQYVKAKGSSNPTVFSAPVAAVFLVNQLLYITWLFVWDQEALMAAAIILLFMSVTNWLVVILFGISLYNGTDDLDAVNPRTKLWLYRLLVHNSFAIYTTWTTVATLINFGIAFIYNGEGSDNKTTCFVMLGLLAGLTVILFALDVIFFDKYFRYMVTPLLVVVWALTGIVFKHNEYTDQVRDSINDLVLLVYILLGASAVLAAARIAIAIYRHIRKPLITG